MQLMVTIKDPGVIQGILAYLGLPSIGAAARAEQPGRGLSGLTCPARSDRIGARCYGSAAL